MVGTASLWLLLGLIPSALAVSEFFTPGPPPYPRWKVGDVRQIRYRTTYTHYSIALWQQFDSSRSAKLGPIVYQTTNGPDNEFTWLVQNYNLDLHASDKFFLWLFEGEPSLQGNQSVKEQQSSGFFFISPSSTTTSSSSSSTSSTATSTTNSASAATSSDTSQNNSAVAANELSTGAKAGIGIGAGIVVLAILSALFLFLRYRSKKKKELEELRSANDRHMRYGGPGEVSKTSVAGGAPPSELPGGTARTELSSTTYY
ncbi:hypothetical protein CP533_2189 [Ophiocordyceps camponoti-saundersi (nom. inval.)]|nr:hypothetical protein CP533_2189 [Ophiocordyceps camponoti-saundersi (nom. inval.)]